MATSYILHNRHSFPMLPQSHAIMSAAAHAFAATSAAVVAAAAGSSVAFFWSFSQMSPSPVRPADWGNIIALALVLLLFRAIFLLIHCASVARLSGAAAPPPSPLDILIATLSSSSSPLTIAFGLIICNITTRYSIHLCLPSFASTQLIPPSYITPSPHPPSPPPLTPPPPLSPAAARALFFCTLVPVTIFTIASITHVVLYTTGHVRSMLQSPARRLLSPQCADIIFTDVEQSRAAQLLSAPLAPAHWSVIGSQSSFLLSPLLKASHSDGRDMGSSTTLCSNDDMFLRFLRIHTNAISTRWRLPAAASAFLVLPPS